MLPAAYAPYLAGLAALGAGWMMLGSRPGRLSRHFTIEEMTRSSKANELGISNKPNSEERKNLQRLARTVLDPLRDVVGKPIMVTSGYRNEKLNSAVGGSKTSQHRKGEAVDIFLPGHTSVELLEILKESDIPFDQAIVYHQSKGGHLHISHTIRRKNRGQVLYKHPDGVLRTVAWN